MGKSKSNKLGDGYISNFDEFNGFLYLILSHEFKDLQHREDFLKYVEDYSDDVDEIYIDDDLASEFDRLNNLWCDYLSELIDMATIEEGKELIDRALSNLPEPYAKRLYKATSDVYEALACQIYKYFDDAGIEYDSPVVRYKLYTELKVKYS